MTLAVVTFKWTQRDYHSVFTAEHVNTLARMVRRHYHSDHRFFCVTDDFAGIDPGIELVQLWDDHALLKNPSIRGGPSCYRRLKLFAPEAGMMFGPKLVSLDLDTVITGDLAPLWDIDVDFKIWGDVGLRQTWFNGSMFLMKAGARRQVWDTFDPVRSPMEAMRGGKLGSDQAWIAHCLGPNERMWTQDDGVFSWRVHLAPKGGYLPPTARIVMFHGKEKPWSQGLRERHGWIRQHYG